jgi:electron transfer flavoprotein-quinone oxidoreductase
MSVLILERGDTPGAKNVTGGRLYAHSLQKIFPGFTAEAPLERRVVRETISMMTADSCFNVDFHSLRFAEDPTKSSYTVLRAELDAWLAGKAEEAGCDLVCPARVDDLILKSGKVCGVVAGEDELTSEVVILADGVNSLLAQKAGLKKELSRHQVGVGCKEIIELPAGVINDRFGLEEGEGMARLMAGYPSRGQMGGAFLYTNKQSLCLGLIMGVDGMTRAPERLPDMLETFKQHPSLRPLIAGGKLVEYSAHLVPEAGLGMLPTLYGDNLMVVGDAAGFCINLGFTVRGMDYAVASGQAAALTAIEAKKKGDFSKDVLEGYKERLEESFVLQDLRTYAHAPDFIEHTPRMYTEYPELIEKVFLEMFTMDGEPARKMIWKMLPIMRHVNPFALLKDGIKGMRAI